VDSRNMNQEIPNFFQPSTRQHAIAVLQWEGKLAYLSLGLRPFIIRHQWEDFVPPDPDHTACPSTWFLADLSLFLTGVLDPLEAAHASYSTSSRPDFFPSITSRSPIIHEEEPVDGYVAIFSPNFGCPGEARCIAGGSRKIQPDIIPTENVGSFQPVSPCFFIQHHHSLTTLVWAPVESHSCPRPCFNQRYDPIHHFFWKVVREVHTAKGP
jgi:hypothetical protein